ncbi:hypothetical protein [Nocardioides rubriscoriae]|uniref:hypothetical protein n=1 Tax=Nocardioides rubriscoriae TaxID=642762 RepID=UPI0011DFDE00|nr:hypothetical protein [Nocardioides rubriscoriae]
MALLLVLGLGGCSDADPQVADLASDPPSPTATPASDPPSSSPTEDPKPESAKAFLRRFGDLERDMQNSGDTQPYRAISDGCVGCDSLADAVDAYYAAGGAIRWSGWKVLSIRSYDRSRNAFLLVVDSTPTVYREAANAPEKRLPGGQSKYVLELERKGDSWLVTDKNKLISRS